MLFISLPVQSNNSVQSVQQVLLEKGLSSKSLHLEDFFLPQNFFSSSELVALSFEGKKFLTVLQELVFQHLVDTWSQRGLYLQHPRHQPPGSLVPNFGKLEKKVLEWDDALGQTVQVDVKGALQEVAPEEGEQGLRVGVGVLTLVEQWLSSEQLSQHASETPNVGLKGALL